MRLLCLKAATNQIKDGRMEPRSVQLLRQPEGVYHHLLRALLHGRQGGRVRGGVLHHARTGVVAGAHCQLVLPSRHSPKSEQRLNLLA